VFNVRTVERQIDENIFQDRLVAALSTVFGGLATILAAVGLYGVMAYMVVRRTREIGIRMALGAERAAVLRLIVGQGSRLAAIGIVLGVCGAFGLSRLMAGLLYGVSATDPLTYAALAAVLAAVAIGACAVPAHRAVRVDPAVALRAE